MQSLLSGSFWRRIDNAGHSFYSVPHHTPLSFVLSLLSLKGYGVILSATWLLPFALIPGTWDSYEFPPEVSSPVPAPPGGGKNPSTVPGQKPPLASPPSGSTPTPPTSPPAPGPKPAPSQPQGERFF